VLLVVTDCHLIETVSVELEDGKLAHYYADSANLFKLMEQQVKARVKLEAHSETTLSKNTQPPPPIPLI